MRDGAPAEPFLAAAAGKARKPAKPNRARKQQVTAPVDRSVLTGTNARNRVNTLAAQVLFWLFNSGRLVCPDMEHIILAAKRHTQSITCPSSRRLSGKALAAVIPHHQVGDYPDFGPDLVEWYSEWLKRWIAAAEPQGSIREEALHVAENMMLRVAENGRQVWLHAQLRRRRPPNLATKAIAAFITEARGSG